MKLVLVLSVLFCFSGMISAGPLKRLPSEPFPADFKAWEPKRILDMSRGAIAKIESGEMANKGLEEKVQQHLKKA